MKTQAVFYRSGDVFVPGEEDGLKALKSVKDGEGILVHVHAPRNIKHFRKAWVLAKKVADNTDLLDKDDAMEFLKIRARHVRFIADPDTGEVHIIPKSISWESLSVEHFNRVYDRFIHIIVTQIMPGIEEKALRKEIDDIIDGELGRRAERGGR